MKAALIGAGQIARQHLACLKTLPGVELTAICDLSPATAEAAAERYGVRAWFTDHRAMLQKVQPDVVHVTTPPISHFRLAMDSFDAGANVIVEKPAAGRSNRALFRAPFHHPQYRRRGLLCTGYLATHR